MLVKLMKPQLITLASTIAWVEVCCIMTDMMLGEYLMHNRIVFTVYQRLQTRLIQKECANSGNSLMS